MRYAAIAALALLATACDQSGAQQRVELEPREPTASEPLPSPDTEGAVWEPHTLDSSLRFGKPEQDPLFTMQCDDGTLVLTRNSPADDGAKAMMAMIGNGRISRVYVDATTTGDQSAWEGRYPANDEALDVFLGGGRVEVTVPGAGTFDLAGSEAPSRLVIDCRRMSEPQEAPPPAT